MSLVSLEVSEKLAAGMRHVAEGLEGLGRLEASYHMGEEVQILVVAHLRGLADTRHGTAQRLGATPTNYIAQAADMAAGAGVVRPDPDGVSLSLRHPVIARAFRDITITAKGSGALTIPVAAIAYGRRAAQFPNLFIFRSKTTGNSFLAQRQAEKGDMPLLLFLLVRSVTQHQDRSLMPSADEINTAAATGLTGYIRRTLQQARLN